MSILKSEALAAALPHSKMTAVEQALRHGESELTNDPELIIPTVSEWDQFYAILTATEDGVPAAPTPNASLELKTYFGPEGVREHYEGVKAEKHATNTEVRANEHIARWFEFIDSEFSLGTVETGDLVEWRGAFLFPTWVDGIVGEVTWMVGPSQVAKFRGMPTDEPRFDVLGSPVPPIFVAPGELIANLNTSDEAWLSGDLEKRLACYEDDGPSAIGIAAVDGAYRHKVVVKTKQDLFDAWSSPQVGRVLELDRLTTILTTFYVFAHYRLALDVGNRTVLRETAALIPVSSNRKFIGELSYSIEVTV